MTTENTLWMGDVEPWMTESIIIKSFQFYNFYPTNVKFIKDKKRGINRTYCFVTFKTIQDATNALINLNGKSLPSTNAIFKLNWADYQSAFTKAIYVGNLNLKVDDNDLFKLFNKYYKSVHHATVINDNGMSKGYGFVIFKNEEEYLRSLKEMNGHIFFGNNIKVKEQKKKDNENNNNNHDLKDNNNKNKKKNKNTIIGKNNSINLNNNNVNVSKQDTIIPFTYPDPNHNNITINNNINNNPKQIINYNNILANNNNFINNNNLNTINLGNNINKQKSNNIINFNTIQNINIINNNVSRIGNNNYLLNKDINNYNQSKSIELFLNKINTTIPYMNKNTYPLINETNKDIINNNNILNNQKDKILYQFDNHNNNIPDHLLKIQNYLPNKKNYSKKNEINNMINNQNKNITSNNNNNNNKKIMDNNNNKKKMDNLDKNEKNKSKGENKNNNINNNQYKLEILDNIDENTLYKKIHESILRTYEYQKRLLNSNNTIKYKSKINFL